LSFGRLAPPRFCFGDSIVMPDFIRHPEKLDTGSEAGMTKASSTETGPCDSINRSRAAQAAESEGGIVTLSFGRLVPPRFCFGDSIVMTDFIRQPEKLDTGSEAGMTKASGTEAEPRYNTNRSRAAQAAESNGNVTILCLRRRKRPNQMVE